MSHRSNVAARRLSILTALAVSAFGCTGASENEDRSTNASNEPAAGETSTQAGVADVAAGNRVIGYFVEWGVYGRNYHVKNIATSGSASKLTHINYAFGNVTNNRCAIGDAYADYDKFYGADVSVDGKADTWDNGALRGSFNQLKKLKAKFPNIKVLISLGGWTWSSGFSDAALPANRASFVKSCIDLYIKDTRWAGLFDGIDVDWEYPAACGNTCNHRPEDTVNFTALLGEFRKQLNAVRPGLQLTIAAPAGGDKISKIQVGAIHPHLDFINLMTYDFHGAWEKQTNFQSPLYNSAGNPAKALKYTTDEAVSLWLDGGTPSNKLVVGIPFYGRGWTGVPNVNNGLWQTATGAAQGTYEQGIDDYKVLKSKNYPGFYHPDTKAYWVFNGSTLWSYDTPTSIGTKTSYIKSRGLGGAMFWELSGDTTNGELITAISNGLQ
ncbi:glycoside hydrolase family 18 protein [Pendulispora albinea]|uniref:chitinase n=1 Tax=Pendulispora albinea TaxID=2741071 RepID=A0ABZ2LU25_9BACT